MSQYLGNVSAYAYAVEKGYTGTEEEFAELMASYADVGQTAVTAAQTATTKASEAATSATTATNKASEATTAATTATTKASEASQSAQTASTKASEASTSAQTASTKASQASQSASQALTYKTAAESAKTASQTAQGLAETAQTAAETAQGLAEDARDEAQSIVDEIGAKASQIDANTASIVTLEEDCYKPYATDTASGAVASFADGADDIPLKSLVVNINPAQSGSGDPSPDNVRPISGWTGCEVQHDGKNLLTYVPNKITAPLSVTLDKSRATLVKKGITYTMSFDMQNATTWRICAILFDLEGNRHFVNGEYPFGIVNPYLLPNASGQYYVWGGNYTLKSFVITPIDDFYVMFFFLLGDTSASTIMVNPMLEVGSTATSYEPYNGQTIPIDWQTEAGTVYGGHLDVLSGVLTVYPYYASYNGETLTGRWISDRDVYAVGTTPTIGAQVVNIGAEGTEIQLSPHEVKSLYGQNNIFADTGDSAVEYRADTKMYIERLTEPDADMIADSNIVSGSYFMVGNALYKATANIASGGQVIVGTNAIRKSLSEALNEINQ